MKTIIIAMLVMVSGCASTRVVSIGKDTYMVQREAGTGFSGTNGIKMDALEAAGAHCKLIKKELEVVSTSENPGGIIGKYPSADVQFKCLDANDPNLRSPTLTPVSATTIEVKHSN